MSPAYTVKECLRGYTEDALGEICDRWQLAASSKPSRIRAVEKILSDPLHIRTAVEAADADMIRLLHLVADAGVRSSADLFQTPGLYSLKPAPMALREAALMGFVLVVPQERAGAFTFAHLSRDRVIGESAPQVFVPPMVARYLSPAAPLGVTVPVAETPADGGEETPSDRATMLLLETMRIVEMVGPRVTANGAIHKSDETRARELAREAGMPNDGLGFSLMVAQELEMIVAKRGRLETTPKAAAWAAMSRAERMRELFQGYLRAQQLPDVRLFFPQLYGAIEDHLEKGSLRRTYHRALAAAVLSEQPAGAWHSVDAFAHTIHQIDRNVFFLEERWRAIQSNVRDPNAAWKDHQWQMREKRLFVWLIQNLLHDMGIVRLANEGHLFQITESGRYALGVGPLPAEDAEAGKDAVLVQPDFEVIVYLDRCTPDLKRKIDTFCERIRAGDVSTYRITQESVYRGVRAGTPNEAFLELLERHSKQPIPGNVKEQFAAWQRKLESIRVHTACELIECDSQEDADALMAECNGSRRIGERYILLCGPRPTVDCRIDYARGGRACLQQDEGLRVRLPWEKADFFIQRRLAEMGDLHAEGGDLVLHLSKDRMKKKEDWTLYAALLESLTEKPLAARYRVALRAWSGDLGRAHSGSATVVRFDAPELCEAAMEFPEVKDFIEGRLGMFALVITQGKLAKFKKALRIRGIVVENDDAIVDETPPAEWAVRWVEENRVLQETIAQRPAEEGIEDEADDADQAIGLPSYSPRIVREIIDDAIARRRPLLIEYRSAWSVKPTIRRLDPVTLDTSSAVPTVSGYCHLHQGPRTFKLSRVTGIRILEDEQF